MSMFPGGGEILILLVGIGVGTLVWGLISAVLFRGAASTYNRFCQPENQVPGPSFGKALLVGIVYTGLLMVAQFVLQMLLGVAMFAMLGGIGGPPGPGGPRFDPVLFSAVSIGLMLVAQLSLSWLMKALLTTGFVPCRFGTASLIALLWAGFEIVLIVAIYATIAICAAIMMR
jgi:hypothetical protein